MNGEQRVQDLLSRGYVEVDTLGRFCKGQRVRGHHEQWPDALIKGTGVLEHIFHRPGRVLTGGVADIEVVVKRDKPVFGPEDTHACWADYNTVVIREGDE